MTAPKKPQDRKPKQDKSSSEGHTVTVTVDGLEVTIDRRHFTDWRFARTMSQIESGQPLKAVDFIERAFGAEQIDLIEKHLEDEDGFVSEDAMAEFVAAVVGQATSPNS